MGCDLGLGIFVIDGESIDDFGEVLIVRPAEYGLCVHGDGVSVVCER